MTDTLGGLLSIAVLLSLLAVVYVPLGDHMARAFTSPRHLRVERLVYRATGVSPDAEQSPRSYLLSVVGFTLVSVAVLMGVLLAQAHLPLSRDLAGMPWWMSFMRVMTRRTGVDEPTLVARVGDLVLDVTDSRAVRGGEEIHLTPIEWKIVAALVRRRGRLVRQSELLRAVWGPGYEGQSNYLRVHLAAIRRKLEPEPSRPTIFVTEPGIGHRFVAAAP